jgi:hypothetical protein
MSLPLRFTRVFNSPLFNFLNTLLLCVLLLSDTANDYSEIEDEFNEFPSGKVPISRNTSGNTKERLQERKEKMQEVSDIATL